MEMQDNGFEDYKPGDKKIPFSVLAEFAGKELIGIKYEQLLPFAKPDGNAFEVISGDYVTTSTSSCLPVSVSCSSRFPVPTILAASVRFFNGFMILPVRTSRRSIFNTA